MAILQSTLDLLRARLDAAFQISDPRAEQWVTLTNPVDLDGRVLESARNKIVMTLAGCRAKRRSELSRASSRRATSSLGWRRRCI